MDMDDYDLVPDVFMDFINPLKFYSSGASWVRYPSKYSILGLIQPLADSLGVLLRAPVSSIKK